MKDVRIGNDIHVSWAILTNGLPLPLQDRHLSLELSHTYGKRPIHDYSIDGNVLHWTFRGKDQRFIGEYLLTLYENRGEDGMAALDTHGFRLVSRLFDSTGLHEPEGLDLGTSHLSIGVSTMIGLASSERNGLMSKEDKLLLESLRAAHPSNIHHGEYNANDLMDEGWYDSVVLGRPERSESDERYFLYHSSNGGQVCFSRRNSGKAFHRLGLGHPWVSLTHDDYGRLESNALSSHTLRLRSAEDFVGSVTASGSHNGVTWYEVYSGNDLTLRSFDLRSPCRVSANDLIVVDCFYRRGFSRESFDQYPHDSDAYIYVSDSAERGHDTSHLLSDFIKVKSLGSVRYPFSESEKNWQDPVLFTLVANAECCRHYIKILSDVPANTPCYVHISGDFSVPGSWLICSGVKVYGSYDFAVIFREIGDLLISHDSSIVELEQALNELTDEEIEGWFEDSGR